MKRYCQTSLRLRSDLKMVRIMDLVIFGAQGIALGAYKAIHNITPLKNVLCFLVTEQGENAESLSGLPVMELDAFSRELSTEEKENIEILIATPESVMSEIERSLDERGLFCHVRLTSERFAALTGYYCADDRRFVPLSALPVGYHEAELHVFMAKFHRDKPLAGSYDIPGWVTPIQVGTALCAERVADVLDCDGENISEKNGNYSELTALYWVWRNCLRHGAEGGGRDYYGLAHYRRMLELSGDDVMRLADNDVDAVLPYPMPYEPDIHAHHERYLKKADWDALLVAVRELQPEYADVFPDILGQQYLYNYNIILAKKAVLREYCEWLFPILERTEELSQPKGRDREDRYIGYMGETLETIYFMKNAERLNITHAGCRLLV